MPRPNILIVRSKGGLVEFKNGKLLGNYFSSTERPLPVQNVQIGRKGDGAYVITAGSVESDSKGS